MNRRGGDIGALARTIVIETTWRQWRLNSENRVLQYGTVPLNFVGNVGTVRKYDPHSGSVKFNTQNDEVSTHIFLYIICNKNTMLITVKIYN